MIACGYEEHCKDGVEVAEDEVEVVVEEVAMGINGDEVVREVEDVEVPIIGHYDASMDEEAVEEDANGEVREDGADENIYEAFREEDAVEDSTDPEYELHDGNESEYFSSDDLGSYGSDSEDEAVRVRSSSCRFDTKSAFPEFGLGMAFSTAADVRSAIARYSVIHGKAVEFTHNEPNKVRVICEKDCPFQLHVSRPNAEESLMVKTFIPDHHCGRIFDNPRASYKFLADYFRRRVKQNPNMKVKDMRQIAKEELRVNVSEAKCKRAKQLIKNELAGSYLLEYHRLEAYAAEIKRSNPGSACDIQLCNEGLREGKRIFWRMFVCFESCKKGWLGGCRPIIGMDGCFLKGVCKGQLLCAVGKDGNNRMFPLAWAIVDVEDKANWRWFLDSLIQTLGLGIGNGLTIISDMQKGLIPAAKEALPQAEHRWCARHVYANWSKDWRGGELKKKFWICAWSTYESEFNINLLSVAEHGEKAATDLMHYDPKFWSRAFCSSRCKSDMIDNNVSETFNSWITDIRDRNIITLLEEIRKKVMTRIVEHHNKHTKWTGDYSPDCMKQYECNLYISSECDVTFCGGQAYEVSHGDDLHTVLLDKRCCTCRSWDITGIPCPHGIAAIFHAKKNPMHFIVNWYHKSIYSQAYAFHLLPVRGYKFWKCEEYEAILPPPVKQQPGRPKKNRVRAKHEPKKMSAAGKLSRKGGHITCSNCKGIGHNKKKCTKIGESSGATVLEPTQPARPTVQVQQVRTRSKAQPTTPTPRAQPTTPSAQSSHASNRAMPPMSKRLAQALARRNAKRKKNNDDYDYGNGVGVVYDRTSGATSFRSSLSTEVVIDNGVQNEDNISNEPQTHVTDWTFRYSMSQPAPTTRGPISKGKQKSANLRKIAFVPDGAGPSNLPFKPTKNLTWNGSPAISPTNIEQQRNDMIQMRSRKTANANNISSSAHI